MDREIVEAFCKSAESDLNLAEELFDAGKYYYASVIFSQQAAEKICKAYLACRGMKSIRKHDVSGILARFIDEKGIIKALQFLEAHVTKARYPFRLEHRLISPPDAYSMKEAELALERAKVVYDFILEKIEKLFYNERKL